MNFLRKIRVPFVFVVFGIGCIIYILFRTPSLKMFKWFEVIGLKTPVSQLRATFYPYQRFLPDWLLYSFPDGAWVIGASGMLLWNACRYNDKKLFYFAWIPTIFACGGEVMQGLGLLKGTFCLYDLAFCAIAGPFTFVLFSKQRTLNENKLY